MSNTPDLSTTAGKLANLHKQLEEAQVASTARQRVEYILDSGSFVEVDALAKHRSTSFGLDKTHPVSDGVVTGYGTINGIRVCIYSQDRSIFDGSFGEVHGEKILKIVELSIKTGVPLIGIIDSSGPRIPEGIISLSLQTKLLAALTRASGLVPIISVVAGKITGAQSYAALLSDFLVLDHDASLHAEDRISAENYSGDITDRVQEINPDYRASSINDALDWVSELVDFLPLNHRSEAIRTKVSRCNNSSDTDVLPALDTIIPDAPTSPYDMKEIISQLVDEEYFFEIKAEEAQNVLVGFARIEGRTVGITGNQPEHNNGFLTMSAAKKIARFIRVCDSFNIPIISFVDCPGFSYEEKNPVTSGATLAYAQAEASVGKISVITRKSLGSTYTIFGSKDLGTDLCFAWPTAEIAVDDAAQAAKISYAADIEKATASGKDSAEVLAEKTSEYEQKYLTPYSAAEYGLIDAVIPASDTRKHLVEGLRLLDRKFIPSIAKKHGNLPF